MKIGTDGCLLGAWADVANAKTILDIGTGSGVIALMLAQRSNTSIDAVEIDTDAFHQACNNFSNSPWNSRVKAHHTSIQEYVKSCKKKYDLIVSCPPYFLDSMKAPEKKRRLARHTDSLSFEELLSGSKRILHPAGKFCTIIPTETIRIFSEAALIEGYFTTKITQTKPRVGSEPIRTLLQMELSRKTCITDSISILETTGKNYTSEYKELTKEFYINF